MPPELNYGTWPSPWTPDDVARSGAFPVFWVGQLAVDVDGSVYAMVRSPGRSEVMLLDRDGPAVSLMPPEYQVQTRIIEYGGAGFVVHDGVVYFINNDQRWYRRTTDGTISPITDEGDVRYGAPLYDAKRSRIICVREDHRGPGEPINTIVAVSTGGDSFGTVLVGGDDFYAWPSLSPDGDRLAWVAWNHPHVPWDVTSLSIGQFGDSGHLQAIQTVVAETDEVACDPQFSPDGELLFCTDRSDWWNYHAWRDGAVEPLLPLDRDFARPLWQMGTSDFRVLASGEILGVYTENGMNRLGRIDPRSKSLTALDLPYTYFARLQVNGGLAYALASSPLLPAVIIEINLETGASRELLVASDASRYAEAISSPQHVSFPSAQGRTGYGFFYPPVNEAVAAAHGDKPPLLVVSHGGPTGCTNTCFNPGIQFWTSRGFAVFDINYAGSTGYGRPFRHLLRGGWGVVDVEDHVAAARYLSDAGLVDPSRLTVRGWSAGGYNTFASLAFADVFHAGAAYFGISDVTLFATETHKFEARYADYLVGPREDVALYRARSPLHSADQIRAPLAMFQGADDKVTPPNQSELILDSLRQRGVPVMYLLFEGEGHGFRRAETNLACLKAELAFYGEVFGFRPADELPPILLENANAIRRSNGDT